MMENKPLIEVVCYSVESAIAAQRGGADRVELCANLTEGGTTPSSGTIETARKHLTIGLFVMIRPRGGDFLYSDAEFEIMKRDVEHCKRAGVDGIVLGMLNTDGSVDKPQCRDLIQLSTPLHATFHRAFDMARDPVEALEDIIECGFGRILTSGQERTAQDGASLIARLIDVAAGRIIIMPGCGIRKDNIRDVFDRTGAQEFHISALKAAASLMCHRNPKVGIGSTETASEYELLQTDETLVREMIQLFRA